MNKEKIIQDLNDFEIMKKIQNGECKIEDFDNETKVRLIALCTQRSNEIAEKLKDLYKNKK